MAADHQTPRFSSGVVWLRLNGTAKKCVRCMYVLEEYFSRVTHWVLVCFPVTQCPVLIVGATVQPFSFPLSPRRQALVLRSVIWTPAVWLPALLLIHGLFSGFTKDLMEKWPEPLQAVSRLSVSLPLPSQLNSTFWC